MTLELPDDAEPVELAAAMCDHLDADGFFGESLIDRLTAVRVEGADLTGLDLVTVIDRPLVGAQAGGGRRHAIRPGLISLDGRGPATCAGHYTVRVVEFDGRPLRATARKEPGTVRPDCRACQRRL